MRFLLFFALQGLAMAPALFIGMRSFRLPWVSVVFLGNLLFGR
jgi:hypothetical protein